MPSLIVTDRDGATHEIEAQEGNSLMELIRDAGLPIEAACGGCAACFAAAASRARPRKLPLGLPWGPFFPALLGSALGLVLRWRRRRWSFPPLPSHGGVLPLPFIANEN